MALTVQNLRAVGTGVEPASLLPGQLAFNVTDKVIYVGDGSDFKTNFDGTQVAGTPGEGWYSMPMDFASLGDYYVANPEFYGDIPTDQQVLTWSDALNHPIWTSNIGGDNQVYVITNNDVAIAPGATTSAKITAAIGVVSPDEGDVTIVTGLPDDVYEGLYFFTTEWVKGAAYAYPSASEVIYNNVAHPALGATVQAAIDDLDDGLIATTAIANTANSTANSALSIASAALPRAGGTMTGPIRLNSTLVDGVGSPGAVNQVLVSTVTGVQWVSNAPGDVTGVTGTTPITVDNTDPQTPVVGINAASTTASGAVQLNDTLISTSTTQAATANAAKVAKDAADAAQATADAAVPRASYAADGDILVGTGAGTFGALGVGTQGQILVVGPGNSVQWEDDAPGDVTGVTGTAPITVNNVDPENPVVGVNLATTATPGVVQIELTGNINLVSGVINVPDGSTTVKGAVQLYNSLSGGSTSLALTAAAGSALQSQIDALLLSNSVTLAGGYDATTGLVDGVTSQGTLAGFTDGVVPPVASATNVDHYLICIVAGANPSAMENGDWLLSVETSPGVYAYQVLGVGARPASASYTQAGIVQLADAAAVLAGTSDTTAITPQALQDNVLDSVTTTNSSQIASSTAVKTAYDAGVQGQTDAATAQATANAALPKTGGTMTGTITAQNVNVQGTYSLQFAGGVSGSLNAVTDLTNVTSSTTAASATAVKSAYDLANTANTTANAALPLAGGTMTGNITFQDPGEGVVFNGGSQVFAISDSTSTTSSTTASSATAVKAAFDAAGTASGAAAAAQATADAALPKTGGTMTGNITFQDAGEGVVFSGGSSIIAISDATGNTNNDVAASSTAVKNAYALADAALPKTGGTMTGNITFQDASEGVVFNGGSSVYAISDSTNLTSSTTAASSTAVKAVAQAGLYLPLATATTIYVNGTNGNDATGLRGTNQAFKTISAALAAASDDDTIIIGPATYTENLTINKSVNLVGTFNDQALDAGPVVVGTTTLTLTSSQTHAAAISNLYFRAATTGANTFVITDNSFSIGGNTVIANCTFASASGYGVTDYCLSMTGTWTRTVYFRECSYQGNIEMAAGTIAGAGAYAVIDSYLGLGQTSNYVRMTSGLLEIRNSSQALCPIFQTGGSLYLSEINGWAASSAALNSVFTTAGWAYKGTSTGLGNCIFQLTGGSNIVADGTTFASVSIGANVIYTLENVSWDTTKVTNAGTPVTAVAPNPNVVEVTQARWSYETLKTTSTVTAANQLATVLDSATGTMYSVAAFDAGTY
jgi:hypothetical protein